MWHYQKNKQAVGPVDAADAKKLIKGSTILRNTPVWREGMNEWLPAVDTELGELFPQDGPPPISPPPIESSSVHSYALEPQSGKIKRLNRNYTGTLISYIVFVAFSFFVLAPVFSDRAEKSALILSLLGFAALLPAIVFFCLFLHQLWALIPPKEAKTTPGKAVGLLFVPFFNLYWNFVAIHGLGKSMNEEAKESGVSNTSVELRATLALCILICVNLFFTVLDLILGGLGAGRVTMAIFDWILFFIFVAEVGSFTASIKTMRDTANATLKNRTRV